MSESHYGIENKLVFDPTYLEPAHHPWWVRL